MDPFKILGVSETADLDEIRTAYRSKARKYHPDSYGGQAPPEASTKMSELNAAFVEAKEQIRQGKDSQTVQVDPEFLTRDRLYQTAQDAEYAQATSSRRMFVAVPLVVLGLMIVGVVVLGIITNSQPVPGAEAPADGIIGSGIELGDCVNVIQGPTLLEVTCSPNVDGVVVGARLARDDSPCIIGTSYEVTLGTGVRACLRQG